MQIDNYADARTGTLSLTHTDTHIHAYIHAHMHTYIHTGEYE